MELELTRVDYALVGITLQGAMKLLPNKKAKEQQKVVIGDQNGVVQLFSVKKDEVQVLFKTVPGNKIMSVQLGGSLGKSCCAKNQDSWSEFILQDLLQIKYLWLTRTKLWATIGRERVFSLLIPI